MPGLLNLLATEQKKLNLYVASVAVIGIAGVLQGRLCTTGLFCKLIWPSVQ